MSDSCVVSRLRIILKAGSVVFGLSAIVLLVLPGFFNKLLGFASTDELEWAMRMIAITLVALAGNMFSVSTRGSDQSVNFSGRVMMISAFGLGLLTLLIPVELNWFTIGYSLIGFGFSAAYAISILKK